jgi:hypothetical protein
MEFRTERETGRVAGGRIIIALYADHEYLGALACAPDAANEVGSRIHLPERLADLHKPCHDPAVARELCSHVHHVSGRMDVECVECAHEWPCRTAVLARLVETPPVDQTIPTGLMRVVHDTYRATS